MSVVESHPLVSGLLLFGLVYLNSRASAPRTDRHRAASRAPTAADAGPLERPRAGGAAR